VLWFLGAQQENLLPSLSMSSTVKSIMQELRCPGAAGRMVSGEHRPEHAAAGDRCKREACPDPCISSTLTVAEKEPAEP